MSRSSQDLPVDLVGRPHDGGGLLRDVEMTYGSGRSAVHALRGVSVAIPAKRLIAVVGPSGSGKTTLLNILGGIELPTAGEVSIDGIDVTKLNDEERVEFRRTMVGFVFQFFNLIPNLTALENVQLIAELLEIGSEREAIAALDAVGLGGRLRHFPSALSGGEQQRVAVARALVKEPSLLLCDEPTGSLDLDTGREVLSLLRRLPAEQSSTVVIVTHNSAIADMADLIVTMGSGQIASVRNVESPIPPDQVVW